MSILKAKVLMARKLRFRSNSSNDKNLDEEPDSAIVFCDAKPPQQQVLAIPDSTQPTSDSTQPTSDSNPSGSEANQSGSDTNISGPEINQSASIVEEQPTKKTRRKIPGGHITPEKIRCAKNIAKNYGRAICNFACTKISKAYLTPILKAHGVSAREFTAHMKKVKPTINGIDTFRMLLVSREEDTLKIIAYKKVFREIGEVFIKYFSVNWIFSSKIIHKLTYLKFRFKILRRLQNPEFFTYLK